MVDRKLIRNLTDKLEEISDQKSKEWWENYVKHDSKFRGVGIPEIRKQLKKWHEEESVGQLSLEEQLELALSFFAEPYSEDKLAGILFLENYLYNLYDWEILVIKFEKLFASGYIFDWNITDWFCVRVLGKLIKENGMPCAKAISEWSKVENVWQARCSVVAFANLTSTEEFIPLLMESCSQLIKRKERFAKTAVGWILRELSKNDKTSVEKFIVKYEQYFSKESFRNAIKYFDEKERMDLVKKLGT